SAMKEGHEFLVFFALLNTIISLYYYLLVVKAMFINKNDAPIENISSDGYLKISLVISMAGIFLLGVVSCIYDYFATVSFGM
ncbi:MAG: NADH-quinone oxidoreductase subunit N, partial [Dysgonomonas sp.]